MREIRTYGSVGGLGRQLPRSTRRVTIDWSTRMSITSMATSHSEPSEVIRKISNLRVAAGARSHCSDCRFQIRD